MAVAVKFGVIFDNDGVLVDSEHISLKAYRQAIREQGVELREEDDARYCGLTDADIIRDMREVYGADLDLERFSSRKRELYFELAAAAGAMRVFDGVRELLELLRANKIPYALASSGSREKILFNLRLANLLEYFDVPAEFQGRAVQARDAACRTGIIVSGEDFHRGKPDPEIFLCAAERLGLSPAQCVIIEDSINGLKAARAAGAIAVGVANTFPAEMLQPWADVEVSSMRELTLPRLEELARATKV
ncbi:MAG: HAD family phosphatase [Candidatus Sumerlaea chitinivorans]|nr:HAD family phosphatase [Candidatus Sumerlaea chitinivorans]